VVSKTLDREIELAALVGDSGAAIANPGDAALSLVDLTGSYGPQCEPDFEQDLAGPHRGVSSLTAIARRSAQR
jgi:hypothetical protein